MDDYRTGHRIKLSLFLPRSSSKCLTSPGRNYSLNYSRSQGKHLHDASLAVVILVESWRGRSVSA